MFDDCHAVVECAVDKDTLRSSVQTRWGWWNEGLAPCREHKLIVGDGPANSTLVGHILHCLRPAVNLDRLPKNQSHIPLDTPALTAQGEFVRRPVVKESGQLHAVVCSIWLLAKDSHLKAALALGHEAVNEGMANGTVTNNQNSLLHSCREGFQHRQARCNMRLPKVRAREDRRIPKLLFDPEELVVFGKALRTARRAGFDLTCAEAHGQVCYEGVLRLPGAVGDHDAPTSSHRHRSRLNCLRNRSDLIHL
mmetsp:Transcript_35042/g.96878  ORF Transcript_35042/g.96878 Transcript_35042/m.96878 type:complete len:251 (-) Transcript_35042:714-1466(-)